MKRFSFAPNHWIYLLVHAVLFLVGILIVLPGTPAMVAIGTSVIATAIAGWVLFLHVLVNESRMERMELVHQFGFRAAYDARSVRIKHEYDSRLSRASSQIDIMGFGLRALRQDYESEFRSWATRSKVRILLLDPEFPSPESSFARQRDKEENDAQDTIKTDVLAFIHDTATLAREMSSKFEIRLYRCLPSVNVFRIDDELFWGPYLVKQASRNLPTFLMSKNGLLFERLTQHFEQIWTSDVLSRKIPIEWLTRDGNNPT